MRELVTGTEVQTRVQSLVDQDPTIQASGKQIIVPMPKPLSNGMENGADWTIAYRGIADGHEYIVKSATAVVENDVNIGGPSAVGSA
jgi:hypothetical protein